MNFDKVAKILYKLDCESRAIILAEIAKKDKTRADFLYKQILEMFV